MPTSKTVTIQLKIRKKTKIFLFCIYSDTEIRRFSDISVDVIEGAQLTEYHRMCDTDPGRQCIVNEEWHSVRCYCNTDNCNADEKCNCDNPTTTTQVPETTSITDGATDLTLSMSVFIASLIIRNF